jgi:hypothetical protein
MCLKLGPRVAGRMLDAFDLQVQAAAKAVVCQVVLFHHGHNDVAKESM